MEKSMEQYKKVEGEQKQMVDYNSLVEEIRGKMKKQSLAAFHSSLYEVLSNKKVKSKFWPFIIKKTTEIMRKDNPEIFSEPNSNPERTIGKSLFNTKEHKRDSWVHEKKMSFREDKEDN